MIQAIETSYKGYRFRSRLEARWAVFFDAMGFDWQYELSGFNFEELGNYLPDFLVYFPFGYTWVEIKPVMPNKEDFGVIGPRLARLTKMDFDTYSTPHSFLLCGTPGDKVLPGILFERANDPKPGTAFLTSTITFAECPFCHTSCLLGLDEDKDQVYCDCVFDAHVKAFSKKTQRDACIRSPLIMQAYGMARSARFEHGETPKVKRGRQNK